MGQRQNSESPTGIETVASQIPVGRSNQLSYERLVDEKASRKKYGNREVDGTLLRVEAIDIQVTGHSVPAFKFADNFKSQVTIWKDAKQES
ncbi:hypothetical protein ACROYT_G005800 [Oculina patagonica]